MRTPATVTCPTCGETEVVTPDGRGFPPDIARRRLAKRCGHKALDMTYKAGVSITKATP
jgi:hypothetical protein